VPIFIRLPKTYPIEIKSASRVATRPGTPAEVKIPGRRTRQLARVELTILARDVWAPVAENRQNLRGSA
jgi:hypothetical protein